MPSRRHSRDTSSYSRSSSSYSSRSSDSYSRSRSRSNRRESNNDRRRRARRPRALSKKSSTLCVRGLASYVSESMLFNAFDKYDPQEVRLIMNKDNVTSKGFGFVDFPSQDVAARIIADYPGAIGEYGTDLYIGDGPVTLDYADAINHDSKARSDWLCHRCRTLNFGRRLKCMSCLINRGPEDTEVCDKILLPSRIPSPRLILSGVSLRVTEEDIEKHMRVYAPVTNVQFVKDHFHGYKKGFALVTFPTLDYADHVINNAKNIIIDNSPIKIGYAGGIPDIMIWSDETELSISNEANNLALAYSQWNTAYQYMPKQMNNVLASNQYVMQNNLAYTIPNTVYTMPVSLTSPSAMTSSSTNATSDNTNNEITDQLDVNNSGVPPPPPPPTPPPNSTNGAPSKGNGQPNAALSYIKKKERYPDPFTTHGACFDYDPKLQLFYHGVSKFYYDASTNTYLDTVTGNYYHYIESSNTFDLFEPPEPTHPIPPLPPIIDQISDSKDSNNKKNTTSNTKSGVLSINLKTSQPKKKSSGIVNFVQKNAQMNKYRGFDDETPVVVEHTPSITNQKTKILQQLNKKQKPICFICSRKFKSDELLITHEKLSELHRNNLKIVSQNSNYRDRAQERRGKYGSVPIVNNYERTDVKQSNIPYYLLPTNTTNKPIGINFNNNIINNQQQNNVFNDSHIGKQMLQQLGWEQGKGLGSQGQGITAPIENVSKTQLGVNKERTTMGVEIEATDSMRTRAYKRMNALYDNTFGEK